MKDKKENNTTIRANAADHLDTLRALDDIEELERLSALFRNQAGRWPQSLQEMAAADLLQGVSVDSAGYPYQLQADGKVSPHSNSPVQLDYGPSPEVR